MDPQDPRVRRAWFVLVALVGAASAALLFVEQYVR